MQKTERKHWYDFIIKPPREEVSSLPLPALPMIEEWASADREYAA